MNEEVSRRGEVSRIVDYGEPYTFLVEKVFI
jgi:hypothetical protein